MRTVKVTGLGRLTVRPDTTRIDITLSGVCPDYAAALRSSAEQTADLRALLAESGFAAEDLKTLDLRVSAEYEGYDDNGVWKNRFTGYRYTHRTKLEFPLDGARLGTVLGAISGCGARPEFSVAYTVKDPEALKDELLRLAVADARKKAAVLASAAGVELKELVQIDCTPEGLSPVIPVMRFDRAEAKCLGAPANAAGFDPGATPDDLTEEQTVDVLWELA